jgi:hypothetical protein
MTKDEALKLVQEALNALENISAALREDDVLGSDIELMLNTITAIKEALAQPERDPWREAVAQPKIDPWREAVAQPEERNFCPRCGKRTADLTTVHTCTPPKDAR